MNFTDKSPAICIEYCAVISISALDSASDTIWWLNLVIRVEIILNFYLRDIQRKFMQTKELMFDVKSWQNISIHISDISELYYVTLLI